MSIDRNEVYKEMKGLFEQQSLHLTCLKELMEQEKSALLDQSKSLLSIAHNKQTEIEKIEQLTTTQQQLLVSAGFTDDEVGIEACINWCPHSSSLIELWQELKVQIADCKKCNLFIGALLEMNRYKVNQLLNIITQGNSGQSTYNAGGRNTQDNSNNTLSIKA